MCGIISVIVTKPEEQENAKSLFKALIVGNETRGRDSTGVLCIDSKTKNFSLFKDTKKSSEFIQRRKFRQVMGDVWLGHTRLATQGEISQRNAHPLLRDKIILVHNGMISNDKQLAFLGNEKGFEYEVDSEVLLPIVQNENWQLLQQLQGTANFIAWNKETNILYIERHNNPLYVYRSGEKGIIALSSKSEELEVILNLWGGDGILTEIPNDTLSFVDLNTMKLKKEQIELNFVKPVYTYDKTVYGDYYDLEEGDLDAEGKVMFLDGKFIEKHNRKFPSELDKINKFQLTFDKNKKSLPKYEDTYDKGEESCVVCDCDLTDDEIQYGYDDWGLSLCNNCNLQVTEIYEKIETGIAVDFEEYGMEFYAFFETQIPDQFNCNVILLQNKEIRMGKGNVKRAIDRIKDSLSNDKQLDNI